MRSLLVMFILTAGCSADALLSAPDAPANTADRSQSSAQQTLQVAPSEPAHDPAERAARAVDNVSTALSRSPTDLVLHNRADRLQELRVVRGFGHATMVVRAADGSRQIRCVDDADEAAGLLKAGAE